MTKPYVLRVSSQKGGVGKTTVAVNLAVVFSLMSYRVLLIDADTSNPCVGFLTGLEEVNVGYKDVIELPSVLRNAVITHASSGVHVLPGTLTSKSYAPSESAMSEFVDSINKQNYDMAIIDTAPGFPIFEPASYIDQALLVTTPDMPSCISIVRLAKMFDDYGVKHSLVVNRVRNKRHEIPVSEISELYGAKPIGIIPEDDVVPISITDHIPAYLFNRESPFSKSIRDIARIISSNANLMRPESQSLSPDKSRSFFDKLTGRRA